MNPCLFLVSPVLTCRRCYADVLSWGTSISPFHSYRVIIPHLVGSPLATEHQHRPLSAPPLSHSPPPHLPLPWRRSWRAAWPPWTGFRSWPCKQPSARTPRMPTGKAWARKAAYWILTPRWTRKRCSSTKTANHRTATPASSRLLSTARQRRRWHWVRSTSGSVTTFLTTGRQGVAGR